MSWRTVTTNEPCPICTHAAWCRISNDGAILCHRETISPRGYRLVEKTGTGSIFRTSSDLEPAPAPSSKQRKRASEPSIDFAHELKAIRASGPQDLAAWSVALGVRAGSIESFGAVVVSRADLERLGIGMQGRRPDSALAWPEYDGAGSVIGLSVRAIDGRKGGAKRSRRGVALPVRRFDPTQTLFVTEGVSDAWALASVSLQAMARPANNAGKEAFQAIVETLRTFRGRAVFVLDADAAGDASIDLCENVARELGRDLHYVRPPAAKDVREWLQSRVAGGLKLDDRGAISSLCDEFVEHVERNKTPTRAGGTDDAPRPVAGIEPRPIDWVWPRVIARRFATLLCGRHGSNKSTLLAFIAAQLTRGRPLPGGVQSPPTTVLYIAGEDREAETLRPRLEAAGADLVRVVLPPRSAVHGRTIEELLAWAELPGRIPRGALIIVDPISSFVWRGFKDNEGADVRALLGVIEAFAERNDWAVVFVRHPNKTTEGPARLRVAGSGAWVDEPRISWVVAQDAEQIDRRFMAALKINVADGREGFSFRVEIRPVTGADDQPVATMLEGGMLRTADEILAAVDEPEAEKSEFARAREWLDGALPPGASIASQEIRARANAERIAPRTLHRAAQGLGVNTRGSRPEGLQGPVHWIRPGPRPRGRNATQYVDRGQSLEDPSVRSIPANANDDWPEGNERAERGALPDSSVPVNRSGHADESDGRDGGEASGAAA